MTSKQDRMIIEGTDFLMERYKFLAPIKPKRKQPRVLYYDSQIDQYRGADGFIGQELEKLYRGQLDSSIVSAVKSHIKDRSYGDLSTIKWTY